MGWMSDMGMVYGLDLTIRIRVWGGSNMGSACGVNPQVTPMCQPSLMHQIQPYISPVRLSHGVMGGQVRGHLGKQSTDLG